MKTITLKLTRPHQGQRKVLREANRFNVVACGRRWGKTCLGVHRLTEPALAGKPVGWFAPSYKYLAEAWRDFNRYLKPVIKSKNETERRLELITGGTLEFWTLEDVDSGRGRKYQRIAVDEAAKSKNLEAWWTNAGRATLADLEGDADFYSTPKGRNFFWRCFTQGTDESNRDWASFRSPSMDNPHIPPGEWSEIKRQLPERAYRQEILAEFIDESGGVFRCVSESIDRGRRANDEPDREKTYCTGIDLARVEDFTVITVFDRCGRQVYFERFNQISWERQIGAVSAVLNRYPGECYVDSTGVGDPIFERLRAAGLNVYSYQFSNQSKEHLIDSLAMQLEQGKLRLMDVPEQENELLAFEYELTPSRNVRMSAPEGMHDDCVIGVALAAWGVSGAGFYSAA
jgi:hypothetical protein